LIRLSIQIHVLFQDVHNNDKILCSFKLSKEPEMSEILREVFGVNGSTVNLPSDIEILNNIISRIQENLYMFFYNYFKSLHYCQNVTLTTILRSNTR